MLVIPGFLATDRTTMALRKALADGGLACAPVGLGAELGRQGRHASQAGGLRRRDRRRTSRSWSSAGASAVSMRVSLRVTRPTKCARSSRSARPFPATCTRIMCGGSTSGSPGTRSRMPPIAARDREATRAAPCDLVAQGRDHRAARAPMVLKANATKRSSWTAAIWRSAVSRKAADQVVREIDKFLKRHN